MERCAGMKAGDQPLRNRFSVRHFVYREGFNPVFVSQVIRPTEWLVRHGLPCSVGVFATLGEIFRPSARRRWDAILQQRSDGGLRLHRFPCLRGRGALSAAASLLQIILMKELRSRKRLILHCRNEVMTVIALELRRRFRDVLVICDYRGIGHAEYGYTAQMDTEEVRKKIACLFELECAAAREADIVICVSNAMKEYVQHDYGVPGSRQIVIPCCPDVEAFGRAKEARASMRAQLGVENRFVVTYCGGLSPWQLPTLCLDVFREIKKYVPEAHFLALTTEDRALRNLAASQGLSTKRTTVLRVRHSEVPRYLAAADVGLLLREASLVNRVSSPVKFGEYLAAGVPVIISDGVGDYSALAISERVGMVLDAGRQQRLGEISVQLSGFVRECQKQGDDLRDRCRAVAQRHLSWDVHLPKLIELYETLASGSNSRL